MNTSAQLQLVEMLLIDEIRRIFDDSLAILARKLDLAGFDLVFNAPESVDAKQLQSLRALLLLLSRDGAASLLRRPSPPGPGAGPAGQLRAHL